MSNIITPDALAEDSTAKFLTSNYVRLTGEQMLDALGKMEPTAVVMSRDGKSVNAAAMIEAVKANPLSTFYYVPREGQA